jgi:endo-1,4-beta-mannosidase
MSLYGWIILALSVGGTTGSLVWCFARVLRNLEKTDRLHAPADLDPTKTDL